MLKNKIKSYVDRLFSKFGSESQTPCFASYESSVNPSYSSGAQENLDFLRHLYVPLGIADEMSNYKVQKIIQRVRPYSLVHESGIEFTIASVIYALKKNIPGTLVEFGTWKGGCSVAMLLTQREFFGKVLRPVYMFDSFEGLPNVTSRDGPLAEKYQRDIESDNWNDNCRAAQEELESLLRECEFSSSEYSIKRGWFADTILKNRGDFIKHGIAVLRLDGDWYDSTYAALFGCCSLVNEEGIVIVDDYYAWDGCARAVHDYFSQSDLPYRIKSLPHNFGAFFIKRQHRATLAQF